MTVYQDDVKMPRMKIIQSATKWVADHFRMKDIGTVEQGTIKPNAALSLEVDHDRRGAIRANHSATHLLHEALRQVLYAGDSPAVIPPDGIVNTEQLFTTKATEELWRLQGEVDRHLIRAAGAPAHALVVTEGSYEFEVFHYPYNHDWEIANCEFTDGHDGVYCISATSRNSPAA